MSGIAHQHARAGRKPERSVAESLYFANATVLDGTGAEPSVAGVLVRQGSVIDVGRFCAPADARVVDCAGLALAPGFVDAHGHSDLKALEGRREKVLQGVTTEVVGNCGFSAFPAATDRTALYEFANPIFCGDLSWGWRGAAEYLAASRSAAINVTAQVGHGTLRLAVAGPKQGPVSEHDLRNMEAILETAFDEGAAGFSTGLMYAPGSSAPFDELERLCRVVARRGKTYSSHIRGYFGDLVDAVDEQIELARRTGCRLQISHMQAVGRRNWPLQAEALQHVERARAEGIDVAFDCYPYLAGSTVLTQQLPQWALEGGADSMVARLTDAAVRSRIVAEIVGAIAWDWADIYISAIPSGRKQELVGRNLAQIGESAGREPVEAMLDLLAAERGAVNMLSFNQSEQNLRATLTHPLSCVISDGFYVKGRPHPRLHGTFPKLLGTVVRERRWMELPEAIRKITDAPARRFGLDRRGRIERGWIADLTVFDPATVGTDATYEKPDLPPRGIVQVYREGKPLL